MAPDLLSNIHDEIDKRLNELGPLLAEYERLLVAVDALSPAGGYGSSPTRKGKRAPASGGPRKPRDGSARRGSAVGATELAPGAKAQDEPGNGAVKQLKATTGRSLAAPIGNPEKAKSERVARGVAREAILGALEHGSHTVGELAIVTAMSSQSINGNLRKLVTDGAVVKTEREGKAAWARADVLSGVG